MTLPIRVLCSILVLALPGVLASADAIDLSAYTGEFEIYTCDRYTRITISAQENELVSRERGKGAVIRLTPIAGEANAFSGAGSEDKSVIFFYRFLRDEGGAHHGGLDHTRNACILVPHVGLMVGLAVVAAAAAACAMQFGIGVKGIIIAGHNALHQIEKVLPQTTATHRFGQPAPPYGAHRAIPFPVTVQTLAAR